jgi:hypothetical protein
MYSFKEKKIHYNRLQNSSAATADLKLLLSINPDAPILPAWGHCPERFANKILYLLLDYATAEEIRKNRRTPVKSEKEKLEETKQELQEAASELEETKEMVQELQEKVDESEYMAKKAEMALEAEKKKEV